MTKQRTRTPLTGNTAYIANKTQPAVDLTPPNAQQYFAMVAAAAKPFGATAAAAVDEPPKGPSEFVKARDIEGLRILVITHAVAPSNFDPMKKQVTYTILLECRPDLGQRKVSLSSQWAIEQAMELNGNSFPFLASVIKGNPEKGEWASLILGEAPPRDRRTYETPEEIAAIVEANTYPLDDEQTGK